MAHVFRVRPKLERLGPAAGSDFGRTYLYARGTGEDRVVVAVNHSDEVDEVELRPDVLAADAEKLWGSALLKKPNVMELPPRSIGIWRDAR